LGQAGIRSQILKYFELINENFKQMKKVLIFGAGRSSYILIRYLLQESGNNNFKITVVDNQIEHANQRINSHVNGEAINLDIKNGPEREKLILSADIVISMLPFSLHFIIAKTCLKCKKDLITASYVTPELEKLDNDVKKAGIIFLNECGLDPGIDHMSAMSVIDKIRDAGHTLRSFETFTGGLLAPSDDENPWQYKFTWNPRNVVLSGLGGVKFLQEGKFKYIPYHKVFRRTEMVHIPGYGYFEGYANRDSLKYMNLYGLEGIKTLYRGTFRRPGFCRAWDIFVQLGATDDSYLMDNVHKMSHKDFINSFLSFNPFDSVELKLAHYMNLPFNSQEMFKMRWLGMFESELVGLDKGTPAQILAHILKKKWSLTDADHDMIVMWHKFEYFEKDTLKVINSYMISKGEDVNNTGMAKTVGFPVGIATKLILNKKIHVKGVQIPTIKEIYIPILKELKACGIDVREESPKEIKMPDSNL
jgi:saccharopine dehydrogenase (NADP+, L-glutamate forming)